MSLSRLSLPLPGTPLLRALCRAQVLCLALAALFACAAARAECSGPAELESALQNHPSAETWAQLGNWFGEQEQFSCAASAFESAVRLEPDSAQLSYLLGLAEFQSQDPDKAEQALQDSIRDDGSALKPHLLLATVYTRRGDMKDAAPEWSAALALDPSNAMALHGLSRCHVALGDFAAEVQLLQKTTLDADLSVDLSIAYMGLGQFDDVIDTLQGLAKTANLQPNAAQNGMAHALLAWAKLMEGQPAAALPAARMAADEMPTLELAQLSLGRALVETGDAAAALPALTAALKLNESSLETHVELARAYAESGRGPEARRERLLCLQMMAAPARPTTATGPQQEELPAQ